MNTHILSLCLLRQIGSLNPQTTSDKSHSQTAANCNESHTQTTPIPVPHWTQTRRGRAPPSAL